MTNPGNGAAHDDQPLGGPHRLRAEAVQVPLRPVPASTETAQTSEDIECPHCEHWHYAGEYPDHGEGDEMECEGCGKVFWITCIEWDPVYYTSKNKP